MKKILLSCSLLAATVLFFTADARAQQWPCEPDTTLNEVGFDPDPIPDGCTDVPYAEVVSFLFPNDTVMLGNTVPFDSFVVENISNIPAGINFMCNVPSCTYVTDPPNKTYGCVLVWGTPTTPSQDSINIEALAYVTVFGSSQSIPVEFKVGFRILDSDTCTPKVGVEEALASLDTRIYPNPLNENSKITYYLESPAHVSIGIYDMMGRKVREVYSGNEGQGEQYKHLPSSYDLPRGVYILRLNLNHGEVVLSRKVVSKF